MRCTDSTSEVKKLHNVSSAASRREGASPTSLGEEVML